MIFNIKCITFLIAGLLISSLTSATSTLLDVDSDFSEFDYEDEYFSEQKFNDLEKNRLIKPEKLVWSDFDWADHNRILALHFYKNSSIDQSKIARESLKYYFKYLSKVSSRSRSLPSLEQLRMNIQEVFQLSKREEADKRFFQLSLSMVDDIENQLSDDYFCVSNPCSIL